MNIRARFLALAVIGVLISTLAPALTLQAQGVFAHAPLLPSRARRICGSLTSRASSTGPVIRGPWPAGTCVGTAASRSRWHSSRGLTAANPWLSAGLLKDGDPIYLVKWETEWPQPRYSTFNPLATWNCSESMAATTATLCWTSPRGSNALAFLPPASSVPHYPPPLHHRRPRPPRYPRLPRYPRPPMSLAHLC